MAEKTKIQYINFYTDGSAARQYELPRSPERNPETVPQAEPRRKRRPVVRVDPLALCSIAVSVVMLVLMAVGMVQLYGLRQQEQALAEYAQELYEMNEVLEEEYRAGYDLDQIRADALALGMIPADQAQHITVSVERPVEIQEEPDFWDTVAAFFSGLFA